MTSIITKPVWHVDGWSGNVVDDNGVDWFVNQDSGWFDAADVRVFDEDKVNGDGTYSSPSLGSSRVITLAGYAQAPTPEAAEWARNQINALCRRGHLFPLLVEEPVIDKTAMVKRAGGRATPHKASKFDFQLILVAPDELKYSVALHTAGTGLALDAPGGVQWGGPTGTTGVRWGGPTGSTGLVYQSGSGENGVVDLVNNGTADAPITFSVVGPVVSPSITRTDTGESIDWPGTVPAGSVLEIHTGRGSVRLNGGNQRPLLTSADFFTVPAGSSIEVAFRSPTPSPTAQLVAVWPDAWY